MNYLPLAKQHGAQIFTQLEVDYLSKWPEGGYIVHYTYHPANAQPATQGAIHAQDGTIVLDSQGQVRLLWPTALEQPILA